MNARLGIASVTLIAAWIAGCKVGPDYVPPAPDMPARWQELADGLEAGDTQLHTWWKSLEDPVLDELIERAVAGNKELDVAFARIRQARALRGIATGERFPDINGDGSVQRTRESEGLEPILPSTISRTDDYYDVGLSAGWEIDVWGRIRRLVESADAEVEASVEDFRDVLVMLLAEVGGTYVEIRVLEERLRVTTENVKTQTETLDLTRDLFDAKLAPELDVSQAELNVANTESSLPDIRQFLAAARYRLGVLVGGFGPDLTELLARGTTIPTPPESVAVGIPADLLRQRPDIRAAERALAAETARIGVATAELYPRFSLTGSFGYQATDDLFDGGNRVWSLGPVATWNLFDGGRVRGGIALQEARTAEALATYEQTVLVALEEVERALVSYTQEIEKVAILQRAVAAAEESVRLVRMLYNLQLTDFQNVQDMETQQFVQQNRLVGSQGRVTNSLIELYEALGGGWQPDLEPAEELEDAEEGQPIP